MKLKYRHGLILRIILIFLSGFTAIFIVMQTHFWLVSIWIGLTVIILILELIRFHERSSRALKNFLLSVQQDDFSNLYLSHEPDKDITIAYQTIQDKFRTLRSQKEAHYQYLSTLVEHVDVALISLDHENNIQLINHTAKELFRIPRLKNIKPLERIDKNLVRIMLELRSGQRQVVKVMRKGEILNLLIRVSEFHIRDHYHKLISFQDIRTELEDHEIESWQKLVRVLNHEIMNSAIPITNLVSVVNELIIDREGNLKNISKLDRKETHDLVECLKTIESRSKGLVNFVQATRNLTRLPKPVFKSVSLDKLFSRVNTLFRPKFSEHHIDFSVDCKPPDLKIKADFELVEQVLINLILNSIDAVKETSQPEIKLSAFRKEEQSVRIELIDNGHGIKPEILDQIFVPYFTTREKGSGIGLSLARQIMTLHKGRIDVSGNEGSGTCFSLEF